MVCSALKPPLYSVQTKNGDGICDLDVYSSVKGELEANVLVAAMCNTGQLFLLNSKNTLISEKEYNFTCAVIDCSAFTEQNQKSEPKFPNQVKIVTDVLVGKLGFAFLILLCESR